MEFKGQIEWVGLEKVGLDKLSFCLFLELTLKNRPKRLVKAVNTITEQNNIFMNCPDSFFKVDSDERKAISVSKNDGCFVQ